MAQPRVLYKRDSWRKAGSHSMGALLPKISASPAQLSAVSGLFRWRK
jgi:hypothetical protein